MRLLVVEDDAKFSEALQLALNEFGTVETANSIATALHFKNSVPFDLLIADYFLPDGNGLSLIENYRQHNPALKTVLISGRTTKEIAIDCVKYKVDGIIEKPFSGRELRETISLLFLRPPYSLNSKESLLTLKDQKFVLTSTEYKIVQILIDNSHRRIGRQEICQAIWGDTMISDNVFDTHLGNLKKKLGDLSSVITNKKGIGYSFDLSKLA